MCIFILCYVVHILRLLLTNLIKFLLSVTQGQL